MYVAFRLMRTFYLSQLCIASVIDDLEFAASETVVCRSLVVNLISMGDADLKSAIMKSQ